MNAIIDITTNSLWDKINKPMVTIITSVYNRREILLRAMNSVACQTYKNIEYIVVNNGSTINIDDIVNDFMYNATIPMMYIRRSSGNGPHTGKNSAIREARGKFLSMLDSDDEFLPNAMQVLVYTWNGIPKEEVNEFREVVAQCIDEFGNRIGEPFPDKINYCSKREASRIWHSKELSVEHINMNITQHLKDRPFPEPEGVSWVVDSVILWDKLSKLYRSYFINDCLKRYYTQSSDSISNMEIKKITIQHCINMLWADKYVLNHWEEYDYGFIYRIKKILHYCIFVNILKQKDAYPQFDWVEEEIKGITNTLLKWILWLPGIIGAKIYVKKRM